ncbi:MAG: hypothetical protein EAZ85_16275 [Bacteroidetes bacterium]|nr:MAG: hypothetical protein EAZ85_16275 [Bacteroidota bacterium]TAG85842.1 MAG: hypothetical protein EAZ20_14095 [Bacteroidota bacterium]
MKLKNILNKAKKIGDILNVFKSEEQESMYEVPKNTLEKFELVYKKIIIGTLTLKDGKWIFKYSDDFKNQSEINTIIDFPNKEKEYNSETLFPFFSFRIPAPQRIKIQNLVPDNVISNEVFLLKKFGKHSIANPYQLFAIEQQNFIA